jgi:hypothetical protein
MEQRGDVLALGTTNFCEKSIFREKRYPHLSSILPQIFRLCRSSRPTLTHENLFEGEYILLQNPQSVGRLPHTISSIVNIP